MSASDPWRTPEPDAAIACLETLPTDPAVLRQLKGTEVIRSGILSGARGIGAILPAKSPQLPLFLLGGKSMTTPLEHARNGRKLSLEFLEKLRGDANRESPEVKKMIAKAEAMLQAFNDQIEQFESAKK